MGKTRVIALVVASLVSTASFVGAQAPAASVQPGRHAAQHGARAGARAERGERGALRGIKLSDAEKANLKAIHSKYATQAKSLRESMKPAMQEARAARQKGDTAAARAVMVRNRAAMEKVTALRTSEQAEVRGALSAENQKQFDANVQQMAKQRADRKANGKNGKSGQRGGVRAQRSGQTG